MSANRKYIQLSIDDLKLLDRLYKIGFEESSGIDARSLVVGLAIHEMLQKAEGMPNPRICLAHAVGRKS